MTINATQSTITGCRFSGNVTLANTFTGTFVGNRQTDAAYTFTNNASGSDALVLHHAGGTGYDFINKAKIRNDALGGSVLISGVQGVGDADLAAVPGGTQQVITYGTTLTANRAVTLDDAAVEGDRFIVSRTAAGAFLLTVKRENGYPLTVLLQNEWGEFEYNGSAWVLTAGGGLPGSAKLLSSTTAVGNVGAGEDNLISLATWSGSIGTSVADQNGVPRAVRVKAWGTTANNANPKTVKLVANTSTLLTTALTVSQVGVWEIEAVIHATGDNAQKYYAKLLQGGTTTLVDVENGTLTLTDSAAITYKCTGTVTDGGGGINNDDIVQEGMTVEFLG
jgi:hypothetical protein